MSFASTGLTSGGDTSTDNGGSSLENMIAYASRQTAKKDTKKVKTTRGYDYMYGNGGVSPFENNQNEATTISDLRNRNVCNLMGLDSDSGITNARYVSGKIRSFKYCRIIIRRYISWWFIRNNSN